MPRSLYVHDSVRKSLHAQVALDGVASLVRRGSQVVHGVLFYPVISTDVPRQRNAEWDINVTCKRGKAKEIRHCAELLVCIHAFHTFEDLLNLNGKCMIGKFTS